MRIHVELPEQVSVTWGDREERTPAGDEGREAARSLWSEILPGFQFELDIEPAAAQRARAALAAQADIPELDIALLAHGEELTLDALRRAIARRVCDQAGVYHWDPSAQRSAIRLV